VPHPRIEIGDVEVVPLCDGFAPLLLADEAPGQSVDWAAERERFLWAFEGAREDSWAWHVHAFLLRTASGPVLIDTGIGHLGHPPYDVVGRIDHELAAAGADAEDVRHVVHTHLHLDHAGGACRPDGEARFPNAVHHVHPADWAFFAHADDPEDFGAWDAMLILEDAGMLDLSPEDREIVPGLRVVHTPGHTPGHRSAVLTDGPFTMLFTGDLLHLPIQVVHPEWESSHDEDPELGVASRVELVTKARDERWGVAVSHFGRPFGGVLREGTGQRWGSA
jgi:glyoxylase-like metal-dependent hydrolase (beta-lactamase superfamily II)